MDAKKEEIKGELEDARSALFTVLQGLSEAAWDTAVYSEEETWTVADILRHLTAAERGMTLQVEGIRKGTGGVPADFDLDRWNRRSIEKAEFKSRADLQAEMRENRSQLLRVIDSIKPEEWELQGRHASLRIMTVEEILRLIADHERRHTIDIRNATIDL